MGLIVNGRSVQVVAEDGSVVVNPDGTIDIGVISDTEHGVRGGGNLHAEVVAGGASGFMSGVMATKVNGLPDSAVPTSRQVIAGSGLTGGGDLTVNRTLAVGVIDDAQHGNRGGGNTHPVVVAGAPGTHGYMSWGDKNKFDGIPACAREIVRGYYAIGALATLHYINMQMGSGAAFSTTLTDEFRHPALVGKLERVIIRSSGTTMGSTSVQLWKDGTGDEIVTQTQGTIGVETAYVFSTNSLTWGNAWSISIDPTGNFANIQVIAVFEWTQIQ